MLSVAVDFDGTLYRPSPNDSPYHLHGEPMPGAIEFLNAIRSRVRLVVHSARGSNWEATCAATDWLARHGFPPMEFATAKPLAALYLDDKGFRFEGDFGPPLEFILKLLEGDIETKAP
jgi:hypothetical protein